MSADVLTDVDLDTLDALDFAPPCGRYKVKAGTRKVIWECDSPAKWVWIYRGHCTSGSALRCSVCLTESMSAPCTCVVCLEPNLPPPVTIDIVLIGGAR